ncbi:polysaccharide biosynthesis C-terminal domain-containing protein [Natronomonas salina]|uniref:oligosaccharide flippase family protein n=1 Tax=Natronomonas salina TaxID=1710540 RepID=UPI0015B4687E|nr:polysaccharide biosynthesis C-terminal domain-containing protein [Natronomonas salina]QLD88774.1 polysaccharide biosynthesis C-terminal domain-containing protein [Natronomonas salina]
MSSRKVVGFISVLGGKFGSLLLGVFINPLIVRILGSENYGDYAFVLSLFAISTTFVHAGMSAGIRKYVAEDRSESYWEEQVFAFYSRLGVALAFLGATVLVVFGLIGPVERLFGDNFSLYFVLLALMVVTNQLFYISRFTLIGLHLERKSEPLQVLKQALFGTIGISLAYAGFNVAGVLLGTAIASLICALAAAWILHKYINLKVVFHSAPNHFPKSDLLRFNLYNTIFILLTISLYNIDLLLLQPISGSHQTGLYKSALIISQFIWMVPQAVQIVFIHSSSEMWSKEEFDEITDMVSQATRYTLLFTLLIIIGIAALASDFIYYYFGSEFVDAVTPLLLLLPGVLGFAIARPIYAVGQGKGELRVLILATGTAAIINLVLNLLLIPRYGMNGAAVATSIGYGSMLVFHGFAARIIGYNPFADLRSLKIFFTALVTAIVVFGLSATIQNSILSLLIVPIIGFFIYTIIAVRVGAIDTIELLQVTDQLPDPIARYSTKLIQKIEPK